MTTNDHIRHETENQAVLDELRGGVRSTCEVGEACSLLLASLLQEPVGHERLPFLDDSGWDSILRMARQHDVASLLCDRLLSRGMLSLVPEPVRAALVDTRQRSAASNLVLLHDAGSAISAMQARGIPVIALKGVHLAGNVYRNAACRRMVDIDLLVPEADLGSAATTLQEAGYTPTAPIAARGDVASGYRHAFHLPRFLKPGHTGIEVHWRLGPETDCCDVAGIWERAVPTRVGGAAALALCPEDALLYLCAHASYKHRFAIGLRPACDVAEVIRRFGDRLEWRSLIARARQWRWDRGVYLSLRLARELLGAAVPDEALRTLRPAAFDDTLVATARAITLNNQASRTVPISVANLARAATVRDMVRVCLSVVFVARSQLADWYNLPRDSHRVLFYYLVRLKDVIARHGRVTMRLLRGDAALGSIAHQKTAIDDWLTEDVTLMREEIRLDDRSFLAAGYLKASRR